MELLTVDNIAKNLCTGCKVCQDICVSGAISFFGDNEGFWYPTIDQKKCVNCGKCFEKCPVKIADSEEKISNPLCSFAAWNKDDNERRFATSGGLFSVFAECVLSKEGFIVASSYTDDFKGAYHTVAANSDELQKLKGSKYFQSNTEEIYGKTKDLIDSGKEVLFVGTPCQVAALYSYLGNRPKNLTTIDFICRGVSSPLLQKKKIEYYEKKGRSKLSLFRDKYKKYAWIDFGARICYENGKETFVSRWRDEILHFFIMKNLNMRPSCYECKFKCGHMKSDITIGDFWQIDRVTEKDLRDGVSALIVNTEHGRNIVESLRPFLYLGKKPLDRIKNGNPSYSTPPDCPSEREEFYDLFNKGGWEAVLKKYKTFRAENNKQKKYHEKRMKKRPKFFMRDDRKNIKWKDFIYYNYISKQVIREKDAYLIPYKGSVIDIQPDARLYIKGNVCINYCPWYPRGNKETMFQIRRGAEVHFNNRVEFAYGISFSVLENAKFTAGYLTTNEDVSIICKQSMKFGNNLLFGRNSIILDSNFHPMYNQDFVAKSMDEELIIEDNVWVGVSCIVLKGSRIGHDTVIGANSLVSGNVPAEVVYTNKRTDSVSLKGGTIWER